MRASRVAHAAGWIVSLACVLYIARTIGETGLSFPKSNLTATIAFITTGALAYSLGVTLLALAWATLASPPSEGGAVSKKGLVKSYLVGQFAKYAPGNVLHFVARHGMARSAGASHSALASAAVIEIFALLSVGSALAIILKPEIIVAALSVNFRIPSLVGIMLLTLPLIFSVRIPFATRLGVPDPIPASRIALCVSAYLLFFVLFGSVYLSCLWMVQLRDSTANSAIGTAAAAWTLGFVIPGPPAGAGVREATLSLITTAPQANKDATMTAILAFRAMTFCGDLLAFVGGLLMRKATNVSAQARPNNSDHSISPQQTHPKAPNPPD